MIASFKFYSRYTEASAVLALISGFARGKGTLPLAGEKDVIWPLC